MDIYKIRTILNGLFILAAIACVVIYFISGYSTMFLTVGLCAIALKLAEFFIRFML